MASCTSCDRDVPDDSNYCQHCGESLDDKTLTAKEIASIQVKLSSYRHNQTGWGISSLIGIFAIVSAGINPNTGLFVAGIAYFVFALIIVIVYEILHENLQRKLEE